MNEFRKPTFRVFVIEAGGLPLVAFEAVSHREASELRKEQWFRDELASLRSKGRPVWDGMTTLTARNATPREVGDFNNTRSTAQSELEELVLTYLVPLDGRD